ncbi:MAG: hypothetical protein JWL95_58 [Gemmatimonadetes bacterium]|nr:hypothetical protein [Gemmatimonadota bacterium]
MLTRKFSRSVFVLVLASSVVTACGSETAARAALTSPQTFATSRANVGALRGNGKAAATTCATHVVSTDSGVFGPAGGTLTFGASRLIIPAGALRDTVTITATIPDGDANRVEFQPHGLQFAKPAGLQLGTAGCAVDDQAAPNVVYLSETGEVLETIDAVYDPHWQTIAASIWHFSGYAIAF